MNEDLSPSARAAQRAIDNNKQETVIRFSASNCEVYLGQFILEEHITYLLNETSNLRFQNANLTTATANHKLLEEQISAVSHSLQQMASNMISLNHQKDIKLQLQESQSATIRAQMSKIKEDLKSQQKRIGFIKDNNEIYLQQIERNKSEQMNNIEQLKIGIEGYYQKQIARVDAIGYRTETIERKLAIMEDNRSHDQEQMISINKIASLYQYEREEIRKGLDKTANLEHNVVMLNDYEKDKKYQKIQSELVKKEIKDMLNEALTPEIRHFLPILIKKIDELNSFNKRLGGLNDQLQSISKEQKDKLEQIESSWRIKMQQITERIDKNYKSLNDKIEKKIAEEIQRLDTHQRSFQQFCQDSKLKNSKNEKQWGQNLKKLQFNLKDYIQDWGEPFFQRKKDFIYNLVQGSKPKQQVQESGKVKQLVFSMEPLLKRVTLELEHASQQLRSSKEIVNEKLTLFNYQIVKIKTDINKQTLETKRILDGYLARLNENKTFNLNLSQMTAALTETVLILYSLSLDQHYLQLQHEVYVTYNDGILCQIQEDSSLLNYRRKEMHPQLLKRAVMTQMVKFIDSTVMQKPLMEWNIKQNRPSNFFTSILNCYVALYDENIDNISKNEGKSVSLQKKTVNSPAVGQGKERSSARRKFVSNNQILSQTIDFANLKSKPVTSAHYQKQEEAYASNRRNIRLKKIQKKDP